MSKENLNIIFTVVFLSIVLFMIIFFVFESLGTFKKRLDNNEYDLEFKENELDISKKTLIDKRTRVYSFHGVNGLNITVDSSNLGNNPYDSPYVDVKEYAPKKKKFKKRNKVLAIIIDTIFVILLVGVVSFGIYSKVSGNIFSINNTSYVTIRTGSMATKLESNTYLEENNLNNQIKTFSLIGLNKIDEFTTLSLYDICAYKDKETNKLIVHRIIKIEEKNNNTYYTFRGDSNQTSDYYLVSKDQILYKFNGFINYPLGIFVSFIDSYIGLVSIVYMCISLFVIDHVYNKKEKLYDKKCLNSVERFNKEEITSLGEVKRIDIY